MTQPGEPSQSRRRSHQLQIEIKPTMDLCNLYIKGLSLSMSSSELFNLFKPYGRIISARVMENAQGLSKGFGFVSYSQPIEAASALVALCGYYSIQFHEPRVLRPDHDAQQQYWCLLSSPLASYFYSNSLSSLPAASSATNPAPFYSVPPQTLHHPAHAYPSYYIYTPYATPSAYMPATTHPHYYYPSTYYPPAYQPTATNPPAISDPARVVMQHALQQVLVNDVELQATVDALMSLDPSDRQKCLEDPTFLKQQLDTLNQRSES
ncbi:hypothetical protein DM01DRAFT_1028699 [Hesseltinella vesiculosa]|uniref:RRM domain-containing protein n=1 Tax=Hesseltinella vesiculosa TaxID=101127 RepID=A0A1X2GIY2_9FUNG|nr:hypothetical protein DM01DRAFT_1028699 [Hesseltinella vesiculosa]